MLVGLLGSFGSFVYNMSEYHVLSDNVPKVQENHQNIFILYKFPSKMLLRISVGSSS